MSDSQVVEKVICTVTRSTMSSKLAVPEKVVPVRFPSGITVGLFTTSMRLLYWLTFEAAPSPVRSQVSAIRTAAWASTRP